MNPKWEEDRRWKELSVNAETEEERLYWRNKLIVKYIDVIEKRINSMRSKGYLTADAEGYLTTDDIHQAAAVGLIKAADKWNPDKGIFCKYFFFHILREVQIEIQKYRNSLESHYETQSFLNILRSAERTGESKYMEMITTEDDVLNKVCNDNMKEIIEKASEHLMPREKDIFFRRANGETLDDLGKAYNVTRERIRQIEKRAQRKLQYWLREYRNDN